MNCKRSNQRASAPKARPTPVGQGSFHYLHSPMSCSPILVVQTSLRNRSCETRQAHTHDATRNCAIMHATAHAESDFTTPPNLVILYWFLHYGHAAWSHCWASGPCGSRLVSVMFHTAMGSPLGPQTLSLYMVSVKCSYCLGSPLGFEASNSPWISVKCSN